MTLLCIWCQPRGLPCQGACVEDLQKDKLLQNPLDAILPKLPDAPRRLRGENSTALDTGFPLADLRSLQDLHSLHSKATASVPLRTLPANQPQVLDDQLFQKLRESWNILEHCTCTALPKDPKGHKYLQMLGEHDMHEMHEMHEMMQDLIAAHEKRQVKIADCVFDSGLSALFLGRGRMESKITSFSPEKDELDLMICKDVEAMQ